MRKIYYFRLLLLFVMVLFITNVRATDFNVPDGATDTELAAVLEQAATGDVILINGWVKINAVVEVTKNVLINRIIKNHFDMVELANTDLNFKSKLIAWTQKEKKSIEFVVVQELGTGFNKQYVVEIRIDDNALAKGQDYSIKGAEQNAAMKVVEKLGINGNPNQTILPIS